MVTRWQAAGFGLSMALVVTLTVLGLWEASPAGGAQWAAYQQAYARLASSQAGTSAEVSPEIVQIEIPALGRVDRCTTCHLGVKNPALADAPEPFRAHGQILDSHPPERF